MENINLKNKLKFWFLSHPKINPYKFSLKNSFQILTSNFRILPDFIIIGAGRAGTTSLYSYLIQHPSIFAASTKNNENIADLHFFEYMTSDKISWYKSHFPTKLTKKIFELKTKKKFVTGEFTSTYMYNGNVPKRIFDLIPNVKLIIILRNPIDKIYSTYSQQFRFKELTSSFEEVIESEMKRMKIIEETPHMKTPNEDFDSYVVPNILRHGIYNDYLKKWFEFFPKHQFLIIDSNQLKNNTQETLDKIFSFLEISSSKIPNLSQINVGNYSKINNSTRKKLIDFFYPHNKKLNNLLETTFDWSE